MTRFLVGALVGFVVGFPLGIRAGVPYARAVRSFRDWTGTRATVRGLRRRTVAMWWKAIKQWTAAVVIAAALVAVVVWKVSARG